MRTKAWQCVAGAALVIGSLSAAQASPPDPQPEMVERAHSTVQRPRTPDQTIYLMTGTGLVAIGGIVLVGGVVGLGGLRIPGGVAMTVGRTRHWARAVRTTGAHRRR